ncbi:gamma-secretase-activating protein [Xenopus laevis]|uniref:Gamma-secretase-activating protein C-terminal domain-containing protein n=2 Tax=Xenopus laevis TaxID=8355 RepID=A0A974DD24_XENLA|nr:gamma-secretase-activating protein [Xenopus laevis]OCT89170.1 hypothetical protein XELAEV_18017787mg [Xenopus laevis]
MVLDFRESFSLQRDVMPWVLVLEAPEIAKGNSRTLRIVNVERNGRVLFTWKGADGFTNIGLYDPDLRQNEMLYSFDKDLLIISCSVNYEKSLLALSYYNSIKEAQYEPLRTVSKYLALLIEIKPINNVRVLKAVDCDIRVQFLYPTEEVCPFPESHLLLVSKEKYIEQFHIILTVEGDNSVVIKKSNQLPRDRIAEDFVWVQWDMLDQRLFYIIPKHSSCVLHCIQFYHEDHFKIIFEVSLELIFTNQAIRLINLGYDPNEVKEQGSSTSVNLQVFTDKTGGLCLFYLQPFKDAKEVKYMVVFLHRGCSKTFKVALSVKEMKQLKRISFINLDGYVVVYLPDHFLHLINTKHPDMMCYHLFLTDAEARIKEICCDCPVQSVLISSVIEYSKGILFSVSLNHLLLLRFLWTCKRDCERLAVLHCFLLHLDQKTLWETEIIEWICENLSVCQMFDPIQEFIIASLYRRMSLETTYLDKLLPYTSLPFWNQEIDGVSWSSDITDMPILKIGMFKGFWEKFHSELDYMKHAHHSNPMHRRDWCKQIADVDTQWRNIIYQRNISENAKKVILNMETWTSDQGIVPLHLEEDYLQKDLTWLMTIKLKDHLSQHLLHVGKNNIDKIVLDYISKQLDLICLVLEVVWKKYNLDLGAFSFNSRGCSSDYFAFHMMCRISEAAIKLAMPLPPGFQTLQLVLGVRCLPLGNLLHYIDAGVLQLTEAFAVKLMKELDDNESNEKLKYSIIIRLPERICQNIHHLWDHAMSNNCIAKKYVKQLLCKIRKRECRLSGQEACSQSALYINFLPLNYLIKMLSAIEEQALNPFEEDNKDAAYLQEIALKQTSVLLGLHKC